MVTAHPAMPVREPARRLQGPEVTLQKHIQQERTMYHSINEKGSLIYRESNCHCEIFVYSVFIHITLLACTRSKLNDIVVYLALSVTIIIMIIILFILPQDYQCMG